MLLSAQRAVLVLQGCHGAAEIGALQTLVTVVRGRVGESPALRPNKKYAWQYAWQCAAEDQSDTPKC